MNIQPAVKNLAIFWLWGGLCVAAATSTDLGEERNLASDEPQIAARLESILKSARTDPGPQIEPEMPPGRRFR